LFFLIDLRNPPLKGGSATVFPRLMPGAS